MSALAGGDLTGKDAEGERLLQAGLDLLQRGDADTAADKLEEALAPILDIDGALRFLAIDIALNNGDGYWTRASDYTLYQDPQGRFHVIPGDMNETFSDGGRGFGFGGVSSRPSPS